MPIHHALWRVGPHPERLTGSQVSEKQLEDMIVEQPEILSSDWMLIARQVKTAFGGIVDLLAVAPDGSLIHGTHRRVPERRRHPHQRSLLPGVRARWREAAQPGVAG